MEEIIERFIIDEIMLGDRRAKLDPNKSLLSSGILDSLALLRLVGFIEEKFDFTVKDGEVTPDNFETLKDIAAYLERKKQRA
jgi:acyl carrier protein